MINLIVLRGSLRQQDILLSNICMCTWWVATLDFYILVEVENSTKINIFMLPLKHKVLITNDNLAKRNRQRCKKCFVCEGEHPFFSCEGEHPVFSCPFACIVYHIVYMTKNITPPTKITNMFINWLSRIDKKTKARIHIAICWCIWLCRNNTILNKMRGINFFFPVILLATH
jgi:hypothetical protein